MGTLAYDKKKALRQAVKELGYYYGVKDASSFVQILLASAESKKISSHALEQFQNQSNDELEKLADAIVGLQGDGIFMEEFCKIIEDYIGGNPGDDAIAKSLAAIPDAQASTPTFPLISVTTMENEQTGNNDGFRRAAKIPEILEGAKIPEGKSISVLEMHHPNLNFANRDTASASVFLMSLPSVEMSKAVPYMDVKIITKDSPMVDDPQGNDGKVFTNGISIYKFLNGEKIEPDNYSTFKSLIEGTPIEFQSDLPSVGGTAGSNDEVEEVPKITVAGMEVFTSPQTMVDGTLQYQDLDTTDLDNSKDIPSENKVLDKFRPFMTLNEFTCKVAPSVGMLSTKSGELSLKLHDKTRLHQIAPLIVPGQLGNVEFLIEWGWSHPQGDPAENPYGALINSMRCKQKWNVINSSYSFTKTGEVEIQLTMMMKGAQNSAFELISNVDGGKRPDEAVKVFTDQIRQAFKDLKSQGYKVNQEMGAPDVLGKTGSLRGLAAIEKEDWEKIDKFLAAMQKRTKNRETSTWSDLAKNIKDAKAAQISMVDQIKKTFKEKIDRTVPLPTPKMKTVKYKKKPKKDGGGGSSEVSVPGANPDGTVTISANDKTIKANASAEEQAQAQKDQENAAKNRKRDLNNTKKVVEKQRAEYGYRKVPDWASLSQQQPPATQTTDPYMVPITAALPSKKMKIIDINEVGYVSFGKLLLDFVADPLIQTGKFDEVQLVFYPINEYAMWAKGLSVASYPINKFRFHEVFFEQLKKGPTMTIQKFLALISKNFFRFQGDDIYGLSSFYGKDEDGKMAVKEKYKKDEKAKIDFAETKREVLDVCYAGMETKKFKKPQIKMYIECVAHAEDEGKTILRLHFFDQATDSHASYSELWAATSSSELGIVGKYVTAINGYSNVMEPPENAKNAKEIQKWAELRKQRASRVTDYSKHYASLMNGSEDGTEPGLVGTLLEAYPITISKKQINDSGQEETVDEEVQAYRIKGGPDHLRGMLAKNMPTLKYGTEFSGILNASLATQSNPAMEAINMKRQGVGNKPQGVMDDGLPLTIRPVTLSLETFGCPFIDFGQQFFVDFQTNTTIDDIYSVTGISHTISPEGFKSSLKMTPLNKMGQYRGITSTLAKVTQMGSELSEITADAKKIDEIEEQEVK